MDEAGTEGIEDVAGELLALPPERFTEARNAAVKQLRADGRKADADAVKRLPRPPLALWALNRLGRAGSPLVDDFLAAAEQLRQAYRTGGDIRAASAPQRAAESALANAAAKAARGEGKNVTDAVMSSIGQTLRAAAADEAIAEDLRKGLLLREPEIPSISELLGSLPAAPAAPRKAAKPTARATAEPAGPAPDEADDAAEAKAEAAARDEQRTALRRQLAEARADATEARREARAASDAEVEARQQWERAKALAEGARRRSDEADEAAEELREQLDQL